MLKTSPYPLLPNNVVKNFQNMYKKYKKLLNSNSNKSKPKFSFSLWAVRFSDLNNLPVII